MGEENEPVDPRTDKEVVASKLRLLLDIVHEKDAESFTYEDVRKGLEEQGFTLTKSGGTGCSPDRLTTSGTRLC